jgi:hypothetical protein
VLPAKTKGPVTLTVFDAHNRKVRSFSSNDKAPAPDASKLAFAPEWLPPHPVPSAAAGMHRFYWDLRYPSAVGSTNPLGSDGVWAVPGKYTIGLSADGQTMRQALTVLPDPRVNVSQAALVREFDLATKVETEWAQDAAALKDATKLMNTLSSRASKATALHAQFLRAMTAISTVSGVPVPGTSPSGQQKPSGNPASLKSLAAEFQKLEHAVDGADADPSIDARTSYASLSMMLASTLAAWNRLKLTDLTEGQASPAFPGKKRLGQ